MPALVLALLAAPAIHAPAPRDEASVRAFLLGIYRYYEDKDGPGAPLDKPELFFEPALAAAIRKDSDEAEARGDMSKMDADPFCYCQDFAGLSNPSVTDVKIAGNRAIATVRFNFGDSVMTIGYTLVWTRKGWRIFDQSYPEGGSTRAMYFPES